MSKQIFFISGLFAVLALSGRMASADTLPTSQCGLYGDFIHEFDWMVGELMKCLEENGLVDFPGRTPFLR